MRTDRAGVLQKLAHIDVARFARSCVPRASRHLAPAGPALPAAAAKRRRLPRRSKAKAGGCVSPRLALRFGGQDGSASQAGQTQRGVCRKIAGLPAGALSAINPRLWGLYSVWVRAGAHTSGRLVRVQPGPPVFAAQRRRLPRRSGEARRRAVTGFARLRPGKPRFARQRARLPRRSPPRPAIGRRECKNPGERRVVASPSFRLRCVAASADKTASASHISLSAFDGPSAKSECSRYRSRFFRRESKS